MVYAIYIDWKNGKSENQGRYGAWICGKSTIQIPLVVITNRLQQESL